MIQHLNTFLDLSKNNPWVNAVQYAPGFDLFDRTMCFWYDVYMDAALKIYYWPSFIAGNSDNMMDLFKPETYSICKN